jgi:uncharacterized protein (DUF305 family)
MNKIAILGIIGTFILVLVLIFAFFPLNGGQFGDNRPDMMGDVDRHFIEQMIPHHEEAIAMADIALTKAEHPEIKQLAENIKRDQTREISQMQEFYKSTYGTDVPSSSSMMGSGMDMGSDVMMRNSTDLTQLENAKPFDKAFIEEMIPHHRMAIMMAQMLLQRSTNSEMRALAQSIIRTQSYEIEQMQGWYRDWYGTDVPESSMGMGPR